MGIVDKIFDGDVTYEHFKAATIFFRTVMSWISDFPIWWYDPILRYNIKKHVTPQRA